MEKTKFEVYIEEKTQNYGKIFLEPLERGYGDTLGNALRRLLLSSIRGAAVTAVRIDGVLHEFSTIKGIREDVIEILMNLKQIPIKAKHDKADEGFKIITLDSDFLPKNFFTRKENPGVITAADLPKDNDFEFCGDNVLCTLEPDAHLLMEIYVEQGVGYLSSERERPAEPSLPIDALLTDAIFSPVKRVNYQIEPARVGKSIDYERLVLEVWTNGAITPEEAVKQASEIAEKCFNKVSETVLTAKEKEREKIEIPSVPKGRPGGKDSELPKTFDEEPAPPAPSTRPISEIGLTVRAANCLLRGGIATLQDLLDRSHEDLLKLRNLGKKSLKEIEEKVEDLGYVLAPSPEIEETEAQPEDVKQEVKEATEFSSKKDPKELLADIFIDSDNAVQEAEDLIKAKNKEEEEKPAKEPTKKTAKSTRVKKSDKSDVKAEEVKEEKEKVEVKEESKDTETEAKSAKKKTSRSKKSEKTEPKVEEVKEEVKEEIKEPETEAKTEKKKSSRSKKSEKSEVKAEEVKEVKETKKEKAAKTAKGKAKKEVEEVKEEVKKPEPEPEAKVEKVEAETEAKPEKKKSSRAKKTEKSDVKAEEVKEVKKVKEAKVKKEKAAVKEEKSEKADKTEKTEKPAKTKATKTKKAAESDSDKKKSASKSKTAKTKKEKDRKEGA